MLNSILFKETLKLAIAKVRTSITYDCSKSSKAFENVPSKELSEHLSIISWWSNCFNLFRHIINPNEDVFVSIRAWKWPHKINSPNIKKLNLYDVYEGHLIAYNNVACPLTSIIFLHKILSIFEKRGPIESTLKYFYCYFSWTRMSPTLKWMTMSEDVKDFCIWHTYSY